MRKQYGAPWKCVAFGAIAAALAGCAAKQIRVTSSPPGAKVYLDSQPVGVTPVSIPIDESFVPVDALLQKTRAITVEMEGYAPFRQELAKSTWGTDAYPEQIHAKLIPLNESRPPKRVSPTAQEPMLETTADAPPTGNAGTQPVSKSAGALSPSPLITEVDVAPRTLASNPDAVAVLIAVKNYRNPNVPPVEYADRDLEAVKRYLLNTLGYRLENIIEIRDASLADFNQVFGTRSNPRGKLANWVRPGKSDVFVYYVGHGAPDPESQSTFFVPSDADPDYIKSGGYATDVFWQILSTIPARNITVVLDTCFSGNSPKGFLLSNVSPALLKVNTSFNAPDSALVMTSAAPDQVSTWYPEKGHSLFTYWWLRGAGGEADADGDRVVTAGELETYLAENVPYWARRLSGREQSPMVLGPKDRVVTALRVE